MDFNDELVFHVLRITLDESNNETGLLNQLPFCLSPDILVEASKMPTMTMSIASGLKVPHNISFQMQWSSLAALIK